MKFVLRVAVLLVRGWTQLYTMGMSPVAKESRREAIDSDLWEYLQDSPAGGDLGAALHVSGRTLRGIRDDLRWRGEQTQRSYLSHAMVTLTVLLLVAAAFLSLTVSLPPLPRSLTPALRPLEVVPPPPPPPEKQGGHNDRDYWRSRP